MRDSGPYPEGTWSPRLPLWLIINT